jgi:4-nitrophenyl phosphatase
MVGDRLNTDIAFGQAGGLATLLVLTGAPPPPILPDTRLTRSRAGITQEAEVFGSNPDPVVPDYVTAALGDLRAVL